MSSYSCSSDKEAKRMLALADSLLETMPDSSLAIVRRDSLMFEKAGKEVRMHYYLLRNEAEDKCFVTHSSDSAMLEVVEYYNRHGNSLQKVRALYELGRIYSDMKLTASALSVYEDALSVEDNGSADAYKSRVCGWIGKIYEEMSLYDKSLNSFRQGYRYAEKANNKLDMIYSMMYIANGNAYIGNNKEALKCYLIAADMAKNINDDNMHSVIMEELACFYADQGLYDKALKTLPPRAFGKSLKEKTEYYMVKTSLFSSLGKLDSTVYYAKKGMEHGTTEMKMYLCLDVAKSYEEAGMQAEAIEYYRQFSKYGESLSGDYINEYRDFIDNVDLKMKAERRNLELAKEKMHLVILISVIVIVVVLLSVKALIHYKKRKIQFREQQERLERYWKEKNEKDLLNIEKNKERIKALEEKLSLSSEEISELQRHIMKTEAEMLQKSNEHILLESEHRKALISEFEHSDIYALYHDANSQPSKKDFYTLESALNKTYKDFTYRLKELYPDISAQEIWICCMIKTGLTSKEICNISSFRPNSLGMARARLYQKIFNEKGSATDLDRFIRSL